MASECISDTSLPNEASCTNSDAFVRLTLAYSNDTGLIYGNKELVQ